MTLLSLWDSLSVSKFSHSQIQGLVGLKFKPQQMNTLIFNLIIIIKILTQVINKFSKNWQNKSKKNYIEIVCVLQQFIIFLCSTFRTFFLEYYNLLEGRLYRMVGAIFRLFGGRQYLNKGKATRFGRQWSVRTTIFMATKTWG